jgi:6-phosphogluconolactonase
MPSPTPINRIVVADPAALADAAAKRLMARIEANRNRIAICLTGGSSPKQLYRLLATDTYAKSIPWDRVHWFIGDERFVSPVDPLNNMAMARGIFLDRFAPKDHIHPIPTDVATPDQAAQLYQRELQSLYGTEELDPARPLFDLVLMGVGPDGHTASLFPGYPAMAETVRWVVGVPEAHVEPFVPRVTLTLPALGSCREMLFELAGAEKRAILTRVLAGENLPANRAHAMGETVWLVDKAALPENFGGR